MNTDFIGKFATSIRTLSMDGVEKANSGHPGLPLGCADIGAVLYGELLKHDPSAPLWPDRDRFILSAGHGSMFLYSLLHLTGYNLPLEELKSFRQIGSLTPGHPEYLHTEGVETTTGPLGAGFSNAVGMAMAERFLASQLNSYGETIIDHYTWTLAGDGCMMEGTTSEAASIAGHLGLGKLIAIYDSNRITIEGDTDIAFSEDVAARFRAYKWHVVEGDAHDPEEIKKCFEEAKSETEKPTLVILTSVIGKGAPTKEGTHSVHGAPLGADEIRAARRKLGVPEDAEFHVDPAVYEIMKDKRKQWMSVRSEWERKHAKLMENPEFRKKWDAYFGSLTLADMELPQYNPGDAVATRSASGNALQVLSKTVQRLIGGSADLAPSTNTYMKGAGEFEKNSWDGRNLHFGVREHAMGGLANGMLLHGGMRTYCATFLVFSDYMRPAVRLASIMNIPQIFVFTHDSIFVGEDGPTHQPIEHVESLRSIPGVHVLRPADAEETNAAWEMALAETERPSALILTRQKLKVFDKPSNWRADIEKGAYIARDCDDEPETVILASGSEVALAIEAAEKTSRKVRVVSVLCRECFIHNESYYKQLTGSARIVAVEAGISSGWYRIADDVFGIDRFGMSGPGDEVARELGFTAEKLAERL